ncbi:hypothetical protein SUDANB105_01027 [Streptomyces sp. enrichment culture]
MVSNRTSGSNGTLTERAGSGEAGPVAQVTATDGNHGRAVARMARLLGLRAHVFVPRSVHPRAVAAIAAEGAQVTEVQGSYDETLPTLAPPRLPAAWAMTLLLHAALTVVWLGGYVLLLAKDRQVLERPGTRRALGRTTGVVLIGLGLVVATGS